MAKTDIQSHVIIMETAKPQAACVHNLGARAGKTDPGLNSPEQDGTDQEGCVLHTGASVIYLTVGDQCSFLLLHRMYERVDTAVAIWCWTSSRLLLEVFLHIFTHNAANTCTFVLQPVLELSS